MVRLRPPTNADEAAVLEWRNSPEVAPFMYRDDPISPEEHALWFKKVLNAPNNSVYRIVEHGGQSAGFSSLTHIDDRHKSCEWGGYLAPNIGRGEGIGRAVIFLALEFAFQDLLLNRVTVEVLIENENALRLYESIGFKREGLQRERAWHTSGPKDVLCLAILASEWQEIKDHLKNQLQSRNLIS